VLSRGISERGAISPPKVTKDLVCDLVEDAALLDTDLIDEASAGSAGRIFADSLNYQFLTDLQNDRSTLAAIADQLESLDNSPNPKTGALSELLVATRSRNVAFFALFWDTSAHRKEQIESRPDVLGRRKWMVVTESGTDVVPRTREL